MLSSVAMSIIASISSAAGRLPGEATPSPAATAGNQVRYVDPASVSPGAIGLGLIVFLGFATFFLSLSMNKQLKKIDFDESGSLPNAAADEVPDADVVHLPKNSQ